MFKTFPKKNINVWFWVLVFCKLEKKTMGQIVFIGSKISFIALRDYIFEHKINQGDTIVLHPQNFESILDEIRESQESIDIPINIFGILLVKDTSDAVEIGKIEIINNDSSQ